MLITSPHSEPGESRDFYPYKIIVYRVYSYRVKRIVLNHSAGEGGCLHICWVITMSSRKNIANEHPPQFFTGK